MSLHKLTYGDIVLGVPTSGKTALCRALNSLSIGPIALDDDALIIAKMCGRAAILDARGAGREAQFVESVFDTVQGMADDERDMLYDMSAIVGAAWTERGGVYVTCRPTAILHTGSEHRVRHVFGRLSSDISDIWARTRRLPGHGSHLDREAKLLERAKNWSLRCYEFTKLGGLRECQYTELRANQYIVEMSEFDSGLFGYSVPPAASLVVSGKGFYDLCADWGVDSYTLACAQRLVESRTPGWRIRSRLDW